MKRKLLIAVLAAVLCLLAAVPALAADGGSQKLNTYYSLAVGYIGKEDYDKAMEYLASGDTVFFAVGAAHMANDAGLVKLLADAGFTVEQISY